jgi:hypothetical protein
MRFGILLLAVAALGLAACGGNSRGAGGSFLDPVCAPDGSIVYVQYANMNGTFDGVQASKENCTWNK